LIHVVKYILSIYIISLVTGCASRIPPDGGPKDKDAPEVVKTIPSQKSTTIQPNKLEFEFNEFIELKDGGSGVLISPPMKIAPDFVIQGKSLVLKMREGFDENTTYTISIGGTIKDITEANLLAPYSLVFSTGQFLDSLSCQGQVLDAYTNAPLKDILVMLYTSSEDSLPKKSLPRYFAKTDESGNYKIENIKEGEYAVFALKDVNANYLYDQPSESIGFVGKMIKIDTTNIGIPPIRVSTETAKKQRLIKSSFNAPSTLLLLYALPTDSLELIDSESRHKLNYFISPDSKSDSLILFLERVNEDTLSIFANGVWNSNRFTDTLIFNTQKANSRFKGKKRQMSGDTSLTFTSNIDKGKLIPGAPLELSASYPAKVINPNSFYWIIDKDTIDANLMDEQDVSFKWKYQFQAPNNTSQAVKLLCLPSAFIDIYNRESDTIRFDFRKMDIEETGNLELSILDSLPSKEIQLVLELIDSKKKVMSQRIVKHGDFIEFKELPPGSYSMRIIEDQNSNMKWDAADYTTLRQAEKMLYYSETISIRAGWDIAVEWNVHLKQSFDLKQKK
jgi:uncharacterized protein (DUF2141 family)